MSGVRVLPEEEDHKIEEGTVAGEGEEARAGKSTEMRRVPQRRDSPEGEPWKRNLLGFGSTKARWRSLSEEGERALDVAIVVEGDAHPFYLDART